jgi:hypothetical protein
MAKKKPASRGGAAEIRRRGMKAIVVLTPRQHALSQLAAGTYTGSDRHVSRWAAAAIEAAALARLAELGITPPSDLTE